MSNQWELIPEKIGRTERDAMIAILDQIDYDFAGRMSMSTRELALYLADARRTIAAAYDAPSYPEDDPRAVAEPVDEIDARTSKQAWHDMLCELPGCEGCA